ncbi:carcinoembryonic antigen-related cell adhesion molecule 2-like isoform X2 [Cyprinus carpio]|uniref:Carcinoembryonic antigen-related cell adhesion molecule 2-like isoform X2 n=1 Tax=Cyprinus carpio TaxID=7962 RepID=A0A9R0B2P1_CYPCA|nr:carcinoembryonic antigen-related cell adhesion molecule 2-like isoform X2 [Cyprinus carpio]
MYIDDAHNVISVRFMIAEISMATSLIRSLPLIFVIMTAGVDGLQDWGVNYSPSYVCALKGSTVKISCVLKYPSGYKIETVFWTKPAVPDGELPNLCLVPENRGRVQCDRENNNTYSITLTNVTEADKHIYYCRFTTNRGTWTGIPGAHLDVTDLQVETQQSVKERESVTLTCNSSCSLPQQTFIWFRNTQRLTTGTITENQLQLQSVSRHDAGNYQCAVSGYERLISPPVYLNIEWTQRAALQTVTGIVAGLIFIIIIIIIFIIILCRSRKRQRECGTEDVNQKQTADSSDDTYTALDPVFRTSADIYSTIRSGDSRAPDDTYTALDLQSRSSDYETLAVTSADPH